jgi:hypothetical protein
MTTRVTRCFEAVRLTKRSADTTSSGKNESFYNEDNKSSSANIRYAMIIWAFTQKIKGITSSNFIDQNQKFCCLLSKCIDNWSNYKYYLSQMHQNMHLRKQMHACFKPTGNTVLEMNFLFQDGVSGRNCINGCFQDMSYQHT